MGFRRWLLLAGLLAGLGLGSGVALADKVQEATRKAVENYITYAMNLATEGQLAEALQTLDKALALDPNNAEIYSLKGSCLERLNRPREAEEAYRKAVQLDPNYKEGYYYLGQFLKRQGKEQEAEQILRRAR